MFLVTVQTKRGKLELFAHVVQDNKMKQHLKGKGTLSELSCTYLLHNLVCSTTNNFLYFPPHSYKMLVESWNIDLGLFKLILTSA